MRRWNLDIDDSAGEPLVHQGRAALLFLLLAAVEDNFSSASLFALLHHKSCSLASSVYGPSPRHPSPRSWRFFAAMPEAEGLAHLSDHVLARKQSLIKDPYAHPLLRAMTEEDWSSTIALALKLHDSLTPLLTRANAHSPIMSIVCCRRLMH